MAASATDKFKKLSRKWVGQIGAAGVSDSSTTTIPLAATTNLPSDTGVVAVIDRVDANGVKTPTLEETVVGIVSGSNISSATRGAEGTAQAHAAGAVVEILVTAKGWNDIVDGILVQHLQNGNHGDVCATNLTLTASSYLDFGAAGAIRDVNDNELLKFTQTASAVNEMTVANAVTGSSVTLSVTGGDTNIGLDLKMKGTGKFRRPAVIGVQAVGPATDTATGDGKAFFRVPAELSGMNLTGVAASVFTAGTTNATTVQLRNVTDTADMLSTRITIDSGEVDTSTAAAAAVIDTDNDDVVTGDIIAVDIDTVSTTAAKGLFVEMRFELP